MRPAAHPLDVLDADGDGRGIPQLEPEDAAAHRRQWQMLNEADLLTIGAHQSQD